MSRLFKRWHKSQKKMKHSLRDTYIYHLLGERLFDHHIWKLEKISLAGGVSLGLFIAFTLTIPFQMLLSAVGAILLRVNLPASLAACWVTNPLTALPIYLAARRLGQYFLEHSQFAAFIFELFSFKSRAGNFMMQGFYLWAGSLIFAIISAFLGNLLIRFVWNLTNRLTSKTADDTGDETFWQSKKINLDSSSNLPLPGGKYQE